MFGLPWLFDGTEARWRMTALLNQAVDALRTLPVARQDELARLLLALIDDDASLSADEKAAIDEAEAQLARGERTTHAQMRAFWQAHEL